MISKYINKNNHHVSDREVDELYQRVRKHDERYYLDQFVIKNKRKFFTSWLKTHPKTTTTYVLYHYNGSEYVVIENNVNKYDIIYYLRGVLHVHKHK